MMLPQRPTCRAVDIRIWVILFMVGLLTTEYTLQSLYYDRMRRNALKAGGTVAFVDRGFYYNNGNAISVPKSTDYISGKGIDRCGFPIFYDNNRHPFNLKEYSYVVIGDWRHSNKQLRGREDADNVHTSLQRAEWQRKRAYAVAKEQKKKLPPIHRNITFVHIGKAGGSTIACNLRAGRRYIKKHCDNIDYDAIDDYNEQQQTGRAYIPESAISRSVNCYTHWRMHLKCYYQFEENHAFMVNLRSPLARIASWFTYEHTENHEIVYADRPHHCGQIVLNSCYQHFEHLTTVGLSYPRPPLTQPLRVGTNLTAMECSHWAWAAVQGNIPADYHNVWNYDWYAHRLFYDRRLNQSDIYALRVEHLEQDWTTVDRMLGGDGAFPSTMDSRQNSAEIKPLKISNHNTTNDGTLNLCRALCHEIQIYKQLLLRSINLTPEDLEQSMSELRETCPEEVDIYPRECHYDTISL